MNTGDNFVGVVWKEDVKTKIKKIKRADVLSKTIGEKENCFCCVCSEMSDGEVELISCAELIVLKHLDSTTGADGAIAYFSVL